MVPTTYKKALATDKTDEAALVKQIVNGHTELFGVLVHRYKDVSLSLACGILGSGPLAEDVLQDAFLKAYSSLHRFKQKAAFSTWLYRIVVNTAYNALKKQQVRAAASIDQGQALQLPDTSQGQATAANERRQIIQAVLNSMKPKAALLLRLYYLGEQSVAEITDITGMRQSQVKVGLHRARQQFKEIIEARLGHEIEQLL